MVAPTSMNNTDKAGYTT